MPGDNVEMKFSGDSADVLREIAKMNQAILKQQQQLAKAGQAGKKAGKESAQSWSSAATEIALVAAKYFTVGQAIQQVIQFEQRLRQEAAETVIQLEKQNKAFQIQAGVTALQGQKAQRDILRIAHRAGIGEAGQTQAEAIATELVSQGFAQPVKSGALAATIQILQSSNRPLTEGTGTAGAIGSFLAGFGLEKNAQNLLDVGIRTRGLFGETPLQVSDLGDLAKAAPAFSAAGVSLTDTLSALTILRESLGSAADAKTGGRNVLLNLTTAGADAAKRRALEGAGLTPEDIDLVGETLPQALKRLGGAIQALPEEKQLGTLKTLFGREGITAGINLISGAAGGKFESFAQLQADRAGFEQGVRAARSGTVAGINRLETAQISLRLDEAERTRRRELEKKFLEFSDERTNQDLRRLGAAGLAGRLTRGVGQSVRDFFIGTVGVDPQLRPEEEAGLDKITQSDFRLGPAPAPQAARPPADTAAAELREMNALMREQNDMIRQQRGGAEVPQRPPVAANGRQR